MGLKADPGVEGLNKTLSEYQKLALRCVWDFGIAGANTQQIFDYVVEHLSPGKTISRASVIFFLKIMTDEGVVRFEDIVGRGGYRRCYYPAMDERGLKAYIVKTEFESLMGDFPRKLEWRSLNSV